MSRHIHHGIPEDAWPDGMEWHAWDADGSGFWYGLIDDPDEPRWYWHAVQSGLPMPKGWNWRVRVERPKENTNG